MELEIRYCTASDGVRIACASIGDGPPLVLLRTYPWEHLDLDWRTPERRRFYEPLARHHQLVLFDGRGCGLSQRDVADVSLDARLRDLEAVADRLALRQLALTGAFNGAALAVRYAARHPDRVTHLVLWDPILSLAEVEGLSVGRALLGLLDTDWGLFTETLASNGFGWQADEARQYAEFMRAAVSHDMARRIFAEMRSIDLTAELGAIRSPTLVVHRSQTPYPGPESVREIAAGIPDARLAVVPGGFADDAESIARIEEFFGVDADDQPSPARRQPTSQRAGPSAPSSRAMPPPVQYTQTSDGVNIAYCDTGQGLPLMMVWAPGFSHMQRVWEFYPDLYPVLARTFRLIAYDPRGCGLSDRRQLDFTIDGMVKDVRAVAAAAGLEEIALCGVADGSPVAIAFAASEPQRVTHLIISDGWAKPPDFNETPQWRAASALWGQDWRLYNETLARVLIGLDDSAAHRYAQYAMACGDPDSTRAVYEEMSRWDVSGLLPAVRAKALVVHSRSHPFQSVESGRQLAARIWDAQFVEVDDTIYRPQLPGLICDFLGVPRAAIPTLAPSQVTVQTVLFTDIEASTATTQRLGDTAGHELVRTHNTIVREALSRHRGREIKHTGDGIMASFASASAALDCAIAIQRSARERSDSPKLRIGINAGEPIDEGGDLFGTTVQLARRICDHAEPGEVLLSDVVRQLAAGKGFLFADAGVSALKGFEEPVRLYSLRWEEGT